MTTQRGKRACAIAREFIEIGVDSCGLGSHGHANEWGLKNKLTGGPLRGQSPARGASALSDGLSGILIDQICPEIWHLALLHFSRPTSKVLGPQFPKFSTLREVAEHGFRLTLIKKVLR